uniref:BESS domain-containing protein n=1 Tax=Amphimedon queenslandica TaxID=400682 RepID=A0A1X7U649_AMPQE
MHKTLETAKRQICKGITITNLIKTDTSQSTGDHESDIGDQGQGDHIDYTNNSSSEAMANPSFSEGSAPSTPSSSITETPKSIQHGNKPPKERKKMSDEVDMALVETLKSFQATRKELMKDPDEDDLFGRQIAATVHRLSNKQKAICKLQIQQVLLNVEFSTDYTFDPSHDN